MSEFNKEFEKNCNMYLTYLYEQAEYLYGDCSELDELVQDTLMALMVKLHKGEKVEHPKGFLSAVLKNKYNGWLREKYKKEIVEYSDATMPGFCDDIEEQERNELQYEEYAFVRREIGRLINIYREVIVRHYVHGQTVDRIAVELKIPRGTVLSRLSSGRNQIREGLENMEKYSQISYEPKTVSLTIWGNVGLKDEPLSLIRSDIESNILILAYENPVSVRGIADTMGMPCAYIEQIIDRLVAGELMGKTVGGLVYTRCFMQRYEDTFGDIPAQEKLAEEYAASVWKVFWKNIEPLTNRTEFSAMSDKQKATLLLLMLNNMLGEVVYECRPNREKELKEPPERPNAGKWLATGIIFENGRGRDNKYDGSGPAFVGYSKEYNNILECRMMDCQSVFGNAHWAYQQMKYNCSLYSILRFYASFLPCDVKADNVLLYELAPEFEKLHILRRDENGELKLDIPAMTFEEEETYWVPACAQIKKELFELLSADIKFLWRNTKVRVPKHVDEAAFFQHNGALMAYVKAQLFVIVEHGLMPYRVEVGKTPLIYVTYRKKEEK